ncbi:MAG: sulfurtransferase TusA family protein [bacterium]
MKHQFDVTDQKCPMTYVKTALRLEELEEGDILEVLVNPGEPLESIPKSAETAGYKILEIKEQDGRFLIVIQK